MKKLLQASAAVLAGISIAVPGIVSAHTGSIDTTGPDSWNTAEFDESNEATVKNNNNLSLANSASQNANSGDVSAKHNTTAGDAASGDADNSNDVSADVSVDNSGSMPSFDMGGSDSSADISNTGPDSHNKVEVETRNEVRVTNNNNVNVVNNVSQSASTGSAKVYGNTTGGDATSGNASNTSSSSFTLSVTN